MRKKLTILVATMCATTILHAEFKAGFSRVDITPPTGVPMIGTFKKRVATGTLDPLRLECVAVSDGKNTGLIYSADICLLSDNFCKRAFEMITAATGVPRDRIFIHATHTHTGPYDLPKKSFSEEENRLLKTAAEMRLLRFVDAGKMAIADLVPATVGIAKTECKNISFIRRYRMKDGSVRTNPGVGNKNVVAPLGTADESVQLVRFKRKGAGDIAIVNFGTHTDTVGGLLFSADWPGVLRETVETAIGNDAKCLFLCGAQGDVNHVNINPSKGRASIGYRPNHKYIGRALAGAVLSIWDICEDVPVGKVNGIVTYIDIPANTPTADEIKWVKMFDEGRAEEIPLKGMELTTLTAPSSRVRWMKNVKSFKIPVSNLSLGNSIAFSGMACEPFVEIGREVKEQSPFRMTVVACLTNGYKGYIPSSKAHKEGGYESLTSIFASPAGDVLVATQLAQLKRLKAISEESSKQQDL